MTSEHTKEPTRQFFAGHNYFGLQEKDVVLFEQNLLPCMGFDGKIFLAGPHKVALAPGETSNTLADIHYVFCVLWTLDSSWN